MNLKEFIKETITSISNAVSELNAENKELYVFPSNLTTKGENNCTSPDGRTVKNVDFNLMVAVEGKGSNNTGLNIQILHTGFESHNTETVKQNIKFSIPVAFPSAKNKY